MITVLAHGCFDILHVGHFQHLEAARSFGDRLVVSITAAAFIKKGPGHPAHDDNERAYQLAALRVVDEVYVCHERTGIRAILKYRPAIYVKGSDYAARGVMEREAEACRLVGAEIRFTATAKRSVAELVSKFDRRVA